MARVSPIDEERDDAPRAIGPRVSHGPGQARAIGPITSADGQVAEIDSRSTSTGNERWEIGVPGTPGHEARRCQIIESEPARTFRARLIGVDADDLHVRVGPEADQSVPRAEAVVPPTGRRLDSEQTLDVPDPGLEIRSGED